MAIVQSSLNEEILNRQERAIIRGIYRAAQLHEGLVQLQKIQDHIDSISRTFGTENARRFDHVNSIKQYLAGHILEALNSTKLPAKPGQKDISSNKEISATTPQ